MKKAFRIIIPLVLVVAILFCTIWYLFVYDRVFTRDILVKAARFFEDTGNLSASAWFYNRAFEHAGNNDTVAIELSNQYKISGNYTKAEYTLTSAIADGGGIDLYMALSKLFVEQNKLLDAVRMIDNVANKDIKAQLEQMRPAAPTCTPDPIADGSHYSQYITIDLSAKAKAMYVNANGEFPSTETDLYNKQGITLKDGENKIYAIAVGENGLASPVSIFAFTVGGVVKEVEFVDPVVETTFRELLNVDKEKTLFTSDLWKIQELTVPAGVKKLDDLQHLVFLKTLTMDAAPTGQLTHISQLPNLEEVIITNTAVQAEELPHLAQLKSLKRLTLNKCSLSTAVGLDQATGLTYLNLSNNSLRDIAPLSNLQNLEELDLSTNALKDILALSGLKKLIDLDVSHNDLTSLTPLSTVAGLEKLDVANNNLTEIIGVAELSHLLDLNASNNRISDVSLLADNTELEVLNISHNKISDISGLSALKKLTNFNFSHNQVTALPNWGGGCALINIEGSNNLIQTLEPLKGLSYLNNVYMDDNKAISNVEILKTCPRLIQVNVARTGVTKNSQVSALTTMGVIVVYDHKG